jgi:hypothetical protein
MESFNFELNQVIARTLAEGGFASEKEATREISLMVALAKISRYERECAKFRKKYGLTFQEFQRKVNSIVGAEVFRRRKRLNGLGVCRKCPHFVAEAIRGSKKCISVIY